MSFPQLPKHTPATLDRIIKDYESPFSVINMVTPETRKAIEALPDELLNLTEEELERKFPMPLASTLQLRRYFLLEYERAGELRQQM